MTRHYHAINGEYGCMPDNNDYFEERWQAVDSLATLFDLEESQVTELIRDGDLALGPIYGAAYCEVMECYEEDCQPEWWWDVR